MNFKWNHKKQRKDLDLSTTVCSSSQADICRVSRAENRHTVHCFLPTTECKIITHCICCFICNNCIVNLHTTFSHTQTSFDWKLHCSCFLNSRQTNNFTLTTEEQKMCLFECCLKMSCSCPRKAWLWSLKTLLVWLPGQIYFTDPVAQMLAKQT